MTRLRLYDAPLKGENVRSEDPSDGFFPLHRLYIRRAIWKGRDGVVNNEAETVKPDFLSGALQLYPRQPAVPLSGKKRGRRVAEV